jgi:hypothetical protein
MIPGSNSTTAAIHPSTWTVSHWPTPTASSRNGRSPPAPR